MNRLLNIHVKEIKYEFLKLLRLPAFAIPTLLFPLMFYLFFGVGLGKHDVGNVKMAAYLVATYGAFGVIGVSLFGFGVIIAVERGQGWLETKRTTPMPISAYFISKIAMAMLFSTIIVVSLFALASLLNGIHLSLVQMLSILGVLVPGAITFSALGLAIGYFAGPNSASPIVNLIYLPMSFLSGLWVPIWVLPKPIQTIAFFLPPFHFSQLALRVLGAGRTGSVLVHVTAMLIATAIFALVAWIGFRRDEGKMYG